jgi:aminoglycoside phosphotransferase (APT) family kinase protein
MKTTELFLLSRQSRFVLRKKPAGQLLSRTAHQIEREYTMLAALQKHNLNPLILPEHRVPVPQPIILCEDVSIIGTQFYVMEFLEGRIFTDMTMPESDPKTRKEWYDIYTFEFRLFTTDPAGSQQFAHSQPWAPYPQLQWSFPNLHQVLTTSHAKSNPLHECQPLKQRPSI